MAAAAAAHDGGKVQGVGRAGAIGVMGRRWLKSVWRGRAERSRMRCRAASSHKLRPMHRDLKRSQSDLALMVGGQCLPRRDTETRNG
jgi:hypothetical protein